MASPCLHSLFELRKVLWCFILSLILTNVPKVSPLCIKGWGKRCFGLVLSLVIIHSVVVLPSLLSKLGSCSDLEVFLRKDVRDRFSGVKLSRSPLEELFHLVQELIVLLHLHSRIFYNQTPIFVKCICNDFTVFRIIS